MIESTCCAFSRKRGCKKCPICDKPIRLAKVLRLLRADARAWWYFDTLRRQGRIEEAIRLERESIRREVRFIRENIGREANTIRTSIIDFPTREVSHRPFDLKPIQNGYGRTSCLSGCHPGIFAAWVYCYANRIGLRFTAKTCDLV